MRTDWYWRRMSFAVFAGILALVFSGCPDPAGNGSTLAEGMLTINGLPSGGTHAVYIFSPGTDISGYQAISTAYGNGSYQAVGTPAGGNSFTLYTWTGGARGGGFTGTGRYPVLLLNSGGSVTDTANPMYARAEVSFSNGAATVSYSAFTAVVSGGGTGTLTISGLPSGATRAVYIFSSGTDISTYAAITAAYGNGSYQAVGAALSGGNSFTLYTWTGGAQGGGFTGTGNYQVLLLNSGGSITDSTNPMYARATVSFSNGTGTVSYSDFTAVVSGSFNFTTPAQYREMVSLNGGTITGNTAYYYDPSTTFDYEKGVFIAGRNVTLSAFKIAKYETTYELWDEVKQWADANGYTFDANTGREGHDGTEGAPPTGAKTEPVTEVSWRDVIVWCNAYSQMSGKGPVYYYNSAVIKNATNTTACDSAVMDTSKNGYRLPTEAEWEYAARGGGTPPSTDRWAGTNDESSLGNYAWYDSNSGNTTHTVGTLTANSAGLHDMSGNVWEWCWDWYDTVGTGPDTNPTGAVLGTYRVHRGGSWIYNASNCAVAYRYDNNPDNRISTLGFRVACGN